MGACLHYLWAASVFIALASVAQPQPADYSYRLVGANGTVVEATGVLEARVLGVVLKLQGQSSPMFVPWEKFDLGHLQDNYPTIYYGYLDARQLGQPVLLRLGDYANLITFEEAIEQLHREIEKPRFYTLPENVNYLFEEDADVMRWKARDVERYNKLMREYRSEMQEFLRDIFPTEGIIIDDAGALHRKARNDTVDGSKGETSLRQIFEVLADTRRSPSRIGLLYLREVSLLQEDVEDNWQLVGELIPNQTFRASNPDHMKLPSLVDESRESVFAMLNSAHLHQGDQYKLGEFYNFIYALAARYRVSSESQAGISP